MAPITKVPAVPRSSSGASSSAQFNEGMRVLVVDDDNISLTVATAYLHRCGYHVTTCTRGTKALSMLRENRQAYDIVLLDVHMPEMNGLRLLEIIGLEMDIPVVLISGDSSRSTIEEGLKFGACDYMVKPFHLNQMQNLWTHVARRRIAAEKKRKRDGSDSDTDHEDNPKKKQRVKWTIELHQKFIEAINILGGIDRAGPKRILELMDVPELSRKHVASHLQKYRDCLKKIAGVRVTNTLEAQALGPHTSTLPEEPAGIHVGAGPIRVNQDSTTAVNPTMQPENASFLTVQGMGSRVAASPLSAQVPDSRNNQEVNVQATGDGSHVNTNGSPEHSFIDEDGMLQEDFLVRYFNSSSDDAFL